MGYFPVPKPASRLYNVEDTLCACQRDTNIC